MNTDHAAQSHHPRDARPALAHAGCTGRATSPATTRRCRGISPTAAPRPSVRPGSTRRSTGRCSRRCRISRLRERHRGVRTAGSSFFGSPASMRSASARCRRCACGCAQTPIAASDDSRSRAERARPDRRGAPPVRRRRARETRRAVRNGEQWTRSLGGVPWTEASVNVPRFAASATIDVPLPCTYDFDVASAKYLAALEDGEIPVDVLLTGTMFYARGRAGCRRRAFRGTASCPHASPCRRGARRSTRPSPTRRGCGSAARRSPRCRAYRSRNAFTTWDETFAALLREAGA